MSIRVLVVDDEPVARQRVRRFLAQEPETEVVGEGASGRDAVRLIRTHSPDVVFLDIQMPKGDGFDVISQIGPERMPHVVFVTAYDEHALRAFEVNAVDYVLKPFDRARLRDAFQRVRVRLDLESAAERGRQLTSLLQTVAAGGEPSAGRGPAANRIMVKSHGRVHFVSADEIDWVEAAGNYVRLHVGSSRFLVRETLTRLEERLDPSGFARIHRSALVNLDRVHEMRHWSSGEYLVVLVDGTELKLSRTYRDRLLERAIGRD